MIVGPTVMTPISLVGFALKAVLFLRMGNGKASVNRNIYNQSVMWTLEPLYYWSQRRFNC